MSMSEITMEEKKNKKIYFHGENIRSKRFQKKIKKKPTLTRAILLNTTIILVSILIVWIFIIFNS